MFMIDQTWHSSPFSRGFNLKGLVRVILKDPKSEKG